jgi:STAS-like domain of unknown function (DUF4325)
MQSLRHSFELSLPFDEFRVWGQRMLPLLSQAGIERACLDVLEYVCTEMLNNVLDHSGAAKVGVGLDWNPSSVLVHIVDDGRGVFAGIRAALALDNDADAAMLVLKGKVTTDPARHTGEGLFFSARVCEWFNLQSGKTGLSLEGDDRPWAYDTPNDEVAGTRLRFRVSRIAPPTLAAVFDAFCPQPELRFTRTVVSVGLMQQADGALVSRSQGKRLVLGLDRFTAVTFDFTGVRDMQQGFADEVFRVWTAAHPDIKVSVLGIGPAVQRALGHVGFAA